MTKTVVLILKSLDNAEKRRKVIELRKEGKTIREIAKEMHMSSRTVIVILKDNNSKEALEETRRKEQEQQNVGQINYTRALRLFKEGKSLLDVTIELGVSAEETKKACFDFWDISNVDDFRRVYEEIKPYLQDLLTVWKIVREKGLDVKDALVAIEHASERAKAEEELRAITDKVTDLQTQVITLNSDIMALEKVRADAMESGDRIQVLSINCLKRSVPKALQGPGWKR